MHSYSVLFPLLTISLLNGASVHSNSPHSPYTQLRVLGEEIGSIKETLEKMKSNESIVAALSDKNQQLASRIGQLEEKNKKLEDENVALKSQLTDLNEVFQKQNQDLLALSRKFENLSSDEIEISDSNGIKKRDLVSVKKDILQIKETLNSTQNEIGVVEKKLADDGAKSSQNLQEQLQKIKSEFLEFCQTINQKFQDFSEQTKNNLTKMVCNNGCVKHTINSGESLASIARLYQTTPEKILSANNLQDTRGLHVGDAIWVPQGVF